MLRCVLLAMYSKLLYMYIYILKWFESLAKNFAFVHQKRMHHQGFPQDVPLAWCARSTGVLMNIRKLVNYSRLRNSPRIEKTFASIEVVALS